MHRRAFLQATAVHLRGDSFDDTVRALSAAETGPAGADNFLTNEDSFPRICGRIAREVPPGVYLGVGPDQNLTYLAHARPSRAFVVDFRRKNMLVHLLHKALFTLSDDRAGYLSRLTARGLDARADDLIASADAARFDRSRLVKVVAEVRATVEPLALLGPADWPLLATIQARLAGPGLSARFLALPMYPTLGRLIRTPDAEGRPAHFLATEALYREVRDLQRAGRVAPIVGDYGAAGGLDRLGEWLRNRGELVAFIYISDVEDFSIRNGRFDTYIRNLQSLPLAGGARLARTSTRPIENAARVRGDSSTTTLTPVAKLLADAKAGRIRRPADLFN